MLPILLYLLMPMPLKTQETSHTHFQRFEILKSDWSPDSLHQGIQSHLKCAGIASSSTNEYYIYDKSSLDCQLGSLLSGGGGSETKVIMGQIKPPSVQRLVLAVGRFDTPNKIGDKAVDVIIPTARSVPRLNTESRTLKSADPRPYQDRGEL